MIDQPSDAFVEVKIRDSSPEVWEEAGPRDDLHLYQEGKDVAAVLEENDNSKYDHIIIQLG
jgi:hypothetical protein